MAGVGGGPDPRPPDPYERARMRLDPQTRPVADVRGLRTPSRRTLLLIFVLLLFLVLVRARAATPPKLARSCTTPAVALSARSVLERSVLRYSVTGPSDARYVLTIDVAGLQRQPDGQRSVVPMRGVDPNQVELASSEQQLRDCRSSGAFEVLVPPGEHTVALFRLTDAGGDAVASVPLRVRPRH